MDIGLGRWGSYSGIKKSPRNRQKKMRRQLRMDGRVPSPRQPRPPEDDHEYSAVVQDVSVADREYALWNNAVVEQLLLVGISSEEALLCVNPRILARVFEEAGLGQITPEQAEQQFTHSGWRTFIAGAFLDTAARLRVLRRCSPGGPPDCVAFLASSVLAAFRLQSDEEWSGNAYYRRLADLLKCEVPGSSPEWIRSIGVRVALEVPAQLAL